MTTKTEAEWLEDAAQYIARCSGAREITTEHLWLALLANVLSPWARLVDEYGGGTYKDWKKHWDRQHRDKKHGDKAMTGRGRQLPEVWVVPADHKLPPSAGLSGFRRLCLTLVGIKVRALAWILRHRRRAEPGIPPWNPQAYRVRRDVHEWAGPQASAGCYLLVLASVPGPHQYMVWQHGPAIAAAARRCLRQPMPGDDFLLALAWPAWRARQAKLRVRARSRLPGASLLTQAAAFGTYLLGGALAVLGVLVVGAAMVFLYALLAPAVLILNGVRSLVALLTGLTWKYSSGMSYPGGELEITWADNPSTRGAVPLLLLPRAALFGLGVFGLAPALARLQGLGQPVISAFAERPDLLKSTGAPLLLAGDLLDTNGILTGFAIIASLGALFLSLPTHRELEQARLARRNQPGSAQRTSLLTGATVAARLADAVESVIGWTASPIYVTVHLVPVVVGLIFATGLAHLTA